MSSVPGSGATSPRKRSMSARVVSAGGSVKSILTRPSATFPRFCPAPPGNRAASLPSTHRFSPRNGRKIRGCHASRKSPLQWRPVQHSADQAGSSRLAIPEKHDPGAKADAVARTDPEKRPKSRPRVRLGSSLTHHKPTALRHRHAPKTVAVRPVEKPGGSKRHAPKQPGPSLVSTACPATARWPVRRVVRQVRPAQPGCRVIHAHDPALIRRT